MLPGPVYPPVLGALESSVLDYLWEHGGGTAKTVHAAVGRRRGITVNTVQSTLKRLYDKGLLTRKKVSHAHVYQPISHASRARSFSVACSLGSSRN